MITVVAVPDSCEHFSSTSRIFPLAGATYMCGRDDFGFSAKRTVIGQIECLCDVAELPVHNDVIIVERASGGREMIWHFHCGFMADQVDGVILTHA
jgi:hypothetical protein